MQIEKPQRSWIIRDGFCLCPAVRRKKTWNKNWKTNEIVSEDVTFHKQDKMCTFIMCGFEGRVEDAGLLLASSVEKPSVQKDQH